MVINLKLSTIIPNIWHFSLKRSTAYIQSMSLIPNIQKHFKGLKVKQESLEELMNIYKIN